MLESFGNEAILAQNIVIRLFLLKAHVDLCQDVHLWPACVAEYFLSVYEENLGETIVPLVDWLSVWASRDKPVIHVFRYKVFSDEVGGEQGAD